MTDTSNAAAAAAPEPTGTGLSDVLKAAETKVVDVAEKAKEAVAAALDSAAETVGVTPPFSTHSDTLAGELSSRAAGYKKMVADLDAKIDQLQAERDDLLHAYNMLSAAMQVKVGDANG